MTDAENVTLEPATEDAAPVLENLLSLYVHDMSEFLPIAVREDGRFAYDWLPLYWSEPDRRFAFLIRTGGRLAGFVLVTRGSPAVDDPECLDVAEFFVLRGYRRTRVGERAATALFERLPGDWVVRVSAANGPGLGFWRRIIGTYTRGRFAERETPGDPHGWHVFTFASGQARAGG